jgi:hypothetical protein
MRPYQLATAAASFGILMACSDQGAATGLAVPMATPARLVAQQSDIRTAFAGFVNFCESGDADVFVTPGGTLHVRGGSNRNLWTTGNPLIDGYEENAVMVNLNLHNGTGAAHLDVSLKPNAVNGTWEIRQTVDISGFTPQGSRGTGHGTGDLRGMTIQFTTAPPQAGSTSSCNPAMGAAGLEGVIIATP